MKTDEEYDAKFEQMGEPAVVAKIAKGFAGRQLALAISFMAVKDHERTLRMEASNSESLKTAKSAKDAAWAAASAARKANALASDANLKAQTSNKIASAAIGVAIIATLAPVIIPLFSFLFSK